MRVNILHKYELKYSKSSFYEIFFKATKYIEYKTNKLKNANDIYMNAVMLAKSVEFKKSIIYEFIKESKELGIIKTDNGKIIINPIYAIKNKSMSLDLFRLFKSDKTIQCLKDNLLSIVVDYKIDYSGLYKIYDKDGVLLYIGKSINLKKRISNHLSHENNWCDQIHKIELIKYHNQQDMDLHEVYYIGKLKPKYNKEFNREDLISITLPEYKITDVIII